MVPDVREITSRSELRLFDGKRQVAEFGDNEILELRCHKSVSTIDFLECELSTTNEDGLAEIRPRRVVELWHAEPAEAQLMLVMRGRVDSVEQHHHRESATGSASFQARSVLSSLVDNGSTVEYEGNVAGLVDRLAAEHGIPAQTDYEESGLRAFIKAASTYGALRLLGATLGAVVQERATGSVRFVSVRRAREELRAQPRAQVNSGNALAATRREGIPVRRHPQS